jgi:hypothetical protein
MKEVEWHPERSEGPYHVRAVRIMKADKSNRDKMLPSSARQEEDN